MYFENHTLISLRPSPTFCRPFYLVLDHTLCVGYSFRLLRPITTINGFVPDLVISQQRRGKVLENVKDSLRKIT